MKPKCILYQEKKKKSIQELANPKRYNIKGRGCLSSRTKLLQTKIHEPKNIILIKLHKQRMYIFLTLPEK